MPEEKLIQIIRRIRQENENHYRIMYSLLGLLIVGSMIRSGAAVLRACPSSELEQVFEGLSLLITAMSTFIPLMLIYSKCDLVIDFEEDREDQDR